MNNTSYMDELIRSVRVLAAEQVEAARSGHPGTPLGIAPAAAALFADIMKIAPADPSFFDRDRFVLSAGHASAMLYAVLHCTGYAVGADDLRHFRQYESITPGHPEAGLTPGVDCSTGPLGQGVANAVGMALAEKILAARYNKPGCEIVSHYTFALCGDGCMQEGIENEAASLAGTMKLGKLILLYDSNGITIEGGTQLAFTEDVAARHRALGWHVQVLEDAEDVAALERAVAAAKAESEKPSLIIIKSVIGYGAPGCGTSAVHGAPLGPDGLRTLKENLGWTLPPFETPQIVKDGAEAKRREGAAIERQWEMRLARYKELYPAEYAEFAACLDGTFKAQAAASESLNDFGGGDRATRDLCGEILAKVDAMLPNLFGGSADLSPSNCTAVKGKAYYSPETPGGLAVHFGVREHAMAAMCNGVALHDGLVPFCSTFFVFSDYMKYGMRMSALMRLPVLYILSHDSIGVGEDGPTHQPVEQLAGLRAMPGMYVYRPCDGVETAAAFAHALTAQSPTAIVTSRQKLVAHGLSTREGARKGGYILQDCVGTPDVILLASGSEIGICLGAERQLSAEGVKVRVVSMPCMDVFEEQSAAYKEEVLPRAVRARVAVEAASSLSWGKYVGPDGAYVCLDTFGISAPAGKLFEKFGFTADSVAAAAKAAIRANQ